MPSESPNCLRHSEQIADLDKRLSVIETILGTSSAEGLRAEIVDLSGKISELTRVIQDHKLAEAQRDGRVQGATWVARLIWAVFGAGALAFASNLFDAFRGVQTPHQ